VTTNELFTRIKSLTGFFPVIISSCPNFFFGVGTQDDNKKSLAIDLFKSQGNI
jgi:hypothetical protein